jgi:hypothetical protein
MYTGLMIVFILFYSHHKRERGCVAGLHSRATS